MIADDELDTQEPDSDPDDEAGGQSGISDDNSGRGIAGPCDASRRGKGRRADAGATRSRLGQINRVAQLLPRIRLTPHRAIGPANPSGRMT